MPKIILASQSPRRHELLKGLDIDFEIRALAVNETYPENLQREDVALYLSKLKAGAFRPQLKEGEVVITADTIVCLGEQVINKPTDRDDAARMLRSLSGRRHDVITAVTVMSIERDESFFSETAVYFKSLDSEEIDYYLDNYKPYDKAGSYGIQEWIGYIAIDRIEGCFYNVMGLPVRMVYDALKRFR